MPAEVLAVANGICFGPLAGAAITWLSAITGAAITFIWRRRLLRRSGIPRLDDAHGQRLHRWFQRWDTSGFVVARLIPVVPFLMLNIGAVFLPLKIRDFILVTAVTTLPHSIIFATLGDILLQ